MSAWQVAFAGQYKRYVQQLLQPSGRGGVCPLDLEFERLCAVDNEKYNNPDEFFTGRLPINQMKNRYPNALPNESTRIELSPQGNGDNTYINANYIDGVKLFGVPFKYIATQAPLERTIGDFWRMVAEMQVKYIVMLTTEAHSPTYWPTQRQPIISPPHTNLTIQLIRQNSRKDLEVREFLMTNRDNNMSSKVMHFMHRGWPTDGVPNDTLTIMDIILTLGMLNDSVMYPIVVHCGAGIGRTGVFIAMHVCLALFNLEKNAKVRTVVEYLKHQRSGMVSTKLQYRFLVSALDREYQRMVITHQQQQKQQQHQQHQLGPAPPSPHLAPQPSGRVSPVANIQQSIAPVKAVPSSHVQDGMISSSSPYRPHRPPSPSSTFEPQIYDHWGGSRENPVPAWSVDPITQPPGSSAAMAMPEPSPHRQRSASHGVSVYPSYPPQLPLPPPPVPPSNTAIAAASYNPRPGLTPSPTENYLGQHQQAQEGWASAPAAAPPLEFARYQPTTTSTTPPRERTSPAPPEHQGSRLLLAAPIPNRPMDGNEFATRIHDAVYGKDATRPQVPAAAGTSPRRGRLDADGGGSVRSSLSRTNSPHPTPVTQLLPARMSRTRSPPPPPTSQPAVPAISSTGGTSQRDNVLAVLARLTEHTQMHRSAPPVQPNPAPLATSTSLRSGARHVEPRPFSPNLSNQGGIPGRIDPPQTTSPGATIQGPSVSPTRSGGSTFQSSRPVSPPPNKEDSRFGYGLGGRLRSQNPSDAGTEGVRKYANDFERSLFDDSDH